MTSQTVSTNGATAVTTTTSATTSGGTPSGELCADPYGFYPHATDCQKYYQCNHGSPVEHTCGAGLLWNDNLKACDWAANVSC